MPLSLSTAARGNFTVLSVGGSIDVNTAPELRDGIDHLVKNGDVRIVVDLDGVDFLDSSALGTLVGANKEIRALQGTLAIVCTRQKLLRVFAITRLDEVLVIAASVDEAVAQT